MSDIILKIENISKQYRLGLIGKGTLSDDLKRWWYKIRGKEDPFLKIGEVNDRSTAGNSDYVWALKDINIEVKRGEVLGIIGKNGAGKSTLLKILSKVTGPTTGTIKSKGRIASLLEVGTGFHGEMTGRENIYLNGAILGMNKVEITSKIDEIIEFSGCERYIDTPVKRYSSGMTVRLAFAVAAFLEPDILVIDEVLAVGDAEFQKKAIGKMQDISQGQGRTVLFVSHNMASVKNLCTECIVLENGRVSFKGSTNESVDFYLSKNNFKKKLLFKPKKSKFIKKIAIKDKESKDFFVLGEQLLIDIDLEVDKSSFVNANKIVIGIYNDNEKKVCDLSTAFAKTFNNKNNGNKLECLLNKTPLISGNYYINIAVYIENEILEHYKECLMFTILDGDYYKVNKLIGKTSYDVMIDQVWN